MKHFLAAVLFLFSLNAFATDACLDIEDGILILTDKQCATPMWGANWHKAIATHYGEQFEGCWGGEVTGGTASVIVAFPEYPNILYPFNPAIFKQCK
jgi:hypothetical protein